MKIIDRTLSCLDKFQPKPEQARRMLSLLLSAGADMLEISLPMYQLLQGDLPEAEYILRVNFPETAEDYPFFKRYVCRRADENAPVQMTAEIQANDIRDINLLSQHRSLRNIRICGFDDVLTHNYPNVFAQLNKKISGNIEMCPENTFHCATAIAVEWVLAGGKNLVTSFGGVGGFAPFEEVVLALHITKRYKPNQDYSMFPEMRALLEEITGTAFAARKAVIGEKIFEVEAGIHVDGILKQPKTYEPFPPELVGNHRSVVIGKHSGKAALALKLRELGIHSVPYDMNELLVKVRKRSVEMQTSLTDEDFIAICQDISHNQRES